MPLHLLLFFGIKKPKEKQQPYSQIVKEIKIQQNKTADVNNTLSGSGSSLSEDKPKKCKICKEDLSYYVNKCHLPADIFEFYNEQELKELEEKEKKIGEELKKNGLVKDKEFNLI